MSIWPESLKNLIKRSPALVKMRRAILWKTHILKDLWGTKVWLRTTQVMTPHGFILDSGFHPAYAQMRDGTFEPDETQLISTLLPSVDVFVDVGANLGYYTCHALQSGKPVIAFEPQKQNLDCLYRNIEANGGGELTEVFPVALSEKPGLLTLYGASGPSASLVKDWAGYSSKFRQIVPVSTLDIILGSRFRGKNLLIKIDVEGAELQVLRGALLTIQSDPKPIWLLEICLEEFHPGGANPDYLAIFSLFEEAGYSSYTATNPPRRVTMENVRSWIDNSHAESGTFNYLFKDKHQ